MRYHILLEVALILSCLLLGTGCATELVRATAYSQTWFGLEVKELVLKSGKFNTEITLVPMFSVAEPRFYEKINKLAQGADLVILEGFHGLGNDVITRETEALESLLAPYSLISQISSLKPGPNSKVVDIDLSGLSDAEKHALFIFSSVEYLLKRFNSDTSTVAPWNKDTPSLSYLTGANVNREVERSLTQAALKAVENLAKNEDWIGRRTRVLVDEIEKIVSGSQGKAPENILVLYGAAHTAGLLELLDDRLGYRVNADSWQNVWTFRQGITDAILPYKANLSITAGEDALLVRSGNELWMAFFAMAGETDVNVITVRFVLDDEKWIRKPVTEAGEDSFETHEIPLVFLFEKGANYTPVMLQCENKNYIAFQIALQGDSVSLYLDPAYLSDGTPLSAEYSVFTGGGVLPVPHMTEITIGHEHRFSRKP